MSDNSANFKHLSLWRLIYLFCLIIALLLQTTCYQQQVQNGQMIPIHRLWGVKRGISAQCHCLSLSNPVISNPVPGCCAEWQADYAHIPTVTWARSYWHSPSWAKPCLQGGVGLCTSKSHLIQRSERSNSTCVTSSRDVHLEARWSNMDSRKSVRTRHTVIFVTHSVCQEKRCPVHRNRT